MTPGWSRKASPISLSNESEWVSHHGGHHSWNFSLILWHTTALWYCPFVLHRREWLSLHHPVSCAPPEDCWPSWFFRISRNVFVFYLDQQGRSIGSWHFNLHFTVIIANHYAVISVHLHSSGLSWLSGQCRMTHVPPPTIFLRHTPHAAHHVVNRCRMTLFFCVTFVTSTCCFQRSSGRASRPHKGCHILLVMVLLLHVQSPGAHFVSSYTYRESSKNSE